jgi:hypothetical protein
MRSYIGQSAATEWLKSHPREEIYGRLEPSNRIQRYRWDPDKDRMETYSGGKQGAGIWSNAKSFARVNKFYQTAPARYVKRRAQYTNLVNKKIERTVATFETGYITSGKPLHTLLSSLKEALMEVLARL